VGQGMRVVLQLTDSISGSGRNVTTDNFFYELSALRGACQAQSDVCGDSQRKSQGDPSGHAAGS